MAEQSGLRAEQNRTLARVARLVTAADGDTPYRDVYLRRAGELLAPIVSESHYVSTVAAREQVARLLAQARAAVARQDWQQVRELGTLSAAVQQSLEAEKTLLSVADTVYGAPPVVLDPLSVGLPPSSKRWSSAAQARADVSAALVELAREDPTARELYASRQHALDALALPTVTTAARAGDPQPSAADIEQQMLHALERGDAAALQGLTDSLLGAAAGARRAATEDAPSAQGTIAVSQVLGEPLPEACVPRAKALGLEVVETTVAVSSAVAAAVADFVERYALSASPAAHERSRDGVARLTVAAEELAVPREVAASFAETVSLLALHVYVNSAGVRFVPVQAPREVLLVECHPEGDDAATPLLRELGLERRRELARDDIEAKLWKNGARVVAEHLGLDPLAFRVVCVPPDVFMRVGRARGWGQRPEWTHFDGYQLIRGGRLRALVGGHSRFGGLFDSFGSIGRDDARENVVARFAVIRRERLGVRIG